jgi:uncharacterized protein YchJ
MRSRYSAFALGLGRYLVDTLDPDHVDWTEDDGKEHALIRALSILRQRQRFLGLRILDTAALAEDEGEVLFRARVFERGVDCSFVELSRFRLRGEAWRYVGGVLLPGSASAQDGSLTREAFLALVEQG